MLSGVVLAFLLTAPSPQEVSRPDTEQIRADVAQLGHDSTLQTLDDLERRFGCSAVPVLVGELHTVNAMDLTYASKDREAEHLAWVVAALRYISGQEFTGIVAKSDLKHRSESARYFLTLGTPPGEAKIVSLWPSRGTIYVGPISTQRRVIEKWMTFSRSGQCHPSDWAGRDQGTFFLGGWLK